MDAYLGKNPAVYRSIFRTEVCKAAFSIFDQAKTGKWSFRPLSNEELHNAFTKVRGKLSGDARWYQEERSIFYSLVDTSMNSNAEETYEANAEAFQVLHFLKGRHVFRDDVDASCVGQPHWPMKHTDFYQMLTAYLFTMRSWAGGTPEDLVVAQAISMEDLAIVFETFKDDPGRIGLAGEEGMTFLTAAQKFVKVVNGRKKARQKARQENDMDVDEP